MIECGSSSSSRSTFLFIWLGKNEDLKTVELSLNLYQGTTKKHTTLQVHVSQSLFDSHRRNPTAVAQRLRFTLYSHTAVHTNVTVVAIATSVTSVAVTVL